jgi:hypothetical protein
MPFTVSCAACNSRFLLGDDLFRRKVSGKVVTVKCRTCEAEISVDATEPATLPSQEPPRRARPAPPRPKHKEGEATVTPLPAPALLSIWDAAEKKAEAPRRPPPPRPGTGDFIDEFDEAPPSSSDAPSLNSLTHEAAPKKQKSSKKAPDDFLVNLSTGTGGILGAPTIDVLGLASAPAADVEELLEVEATELTPRAGTVPLFDMSAVLPLANDASKSVGSSLSPSHLDLAIDVDMPQSAGSDGKKRERKYVVAPTTRQATPQKTRRIGAAVWFALVAAAAGVLLVVGMRGRTNSHHVSPEPPPAEHPASVVDTPPTSDLPATTQAPAMTAAEPAPSEADTSPTKISANVVTPSAGTATSPNSANAPATAGVAKPAEVEHQKEETTQAVAPAEQEKPAVQAPRAAPEPAEPGTDFDRSAAVAALQAAAAEAASCRKDGDPSGTARLTITFAPSGRVTSANIQGPPFAGTPTGGCIANAMRHAHVPAFSGDRVTVNKTIAVE